MNVRKEEVRVAFRKADGNATKAAELLQVSKTTLNNWIRDLEMRDELDKEWPLRMRISRRKKGPEK